MASASSRAAASMPQGPEIQSRLQAVVQLGGHHAARGIEPGQQRRHAGLLQRQAVRAARRLHELHSDSSTGVAGGVLKLSRRRRSRSSGRARSGGPSAGRPA